jgi:23S rRNA (cytosine1962-C5)-methyltransferase
VAKGAIRFITDDATKFVKREHRRESLYDGIIIDPPTFGRGPKGEVWKIERDLYPLVEACCRLLGDRPLFVLLTSHSPGVTPSVLRSMPCPLNEVASGEMLLKGDGPQVPAGVFARWW